MLGIGNTVVQVAANPLLQDGNTQGQVIQFPEPGTVYQGHRLLTRSDSDDLHGGKDGVTGSWPLPFMH